MPSIGRERVAPRRESMNALDRETIAALQAVKVGLNQHAGRFITSMQEARLAGEQITVRQRHALYAIAYRYRRQIDIKLQVRVVIALTEWTAAAELARLAQADPSLTARTASAAPHLTVVRNPLDDLFTRPAEG